MATAKRLAAVYSRNGRHDKAEALYSRVLATKKKAPGIGNVEIASAHLDLANFFRTQGRMLEAAIALNNTLTIYEKILPPNDPKIVMVLNNLGFLYQKRGQTKDANATFERLLKLMEENNPSRRGAKIRRRDEIAKVLQNLGTINQKMGHPGKAENRFKQALGYLVEPGRERQSVSASLARVNLAIHYTEQNNLDAAEGHFKKALAELALAKTGYDGREFQNPALDIPIADTLRHYAALDAKLKRFEQAKSRYQNALMLYKKHFHANDSGISTIVIKIGGAICGTKNWPHAVRYYSDGTEMIKNRLRGRWGTRSDPNAGEFMPGEVAREIEYFKTLIKINHQRIAEIKRPVKTAIEIDNSYQTIQWGLSSKAAASLQKMAARGAVAGSKFGQEIRKRQNLTAEWQALSNTLLEATAQPAEKQNANNIGKMRRRLATIDQLLKPVNPDFMKELEKLSALSSPEALSISDTQQHLKTNEALLFLVDTSDSLGIPEETFIWVVTKTDARWVRSPMGTGALEREVSLLRCGLDPTLRTNYPTILKTDSVAVKRTKKARQKLMETCQEAFPEGGPSSKLLPFDLKRAHKLYKSLFGEVEDLIKGKDLLIVPSGPLTQLPFQVLVTKKPDARLTGTRALRKASWLARDHTITVLPAVSSLKALRAPPTTSKAQKSYIGFGNPLLNGKKNDSTHASRAALSQKITSCKALSTDEVRTRLAVLGSTTLLGGSPTPKVRSMDSAWVKRQIPVPETANQLCHVARSFKAQDVAVHLAADASEENVKGLSKADVLAQYKVIHFATHGVLAGELNVNSEPGLILTPPKEDKTSVTDDGFLSASEVAGLKLDADWVVLSACNTAAGGARNAEALSGLARAFFYAGARSLLVSHWSNYSNSTSQLISEAVTRAAGMGRAKALQFAMLNMIDNGHARWAHPTYWAPFVLVGEGAK